MGQPLRASAVHYFTLGTDLIPAQPILGLVLPPDLPQHCPPSSHPLEIQGPYGPWVVGVTSRGRCSFRACWARQGCAEVPKWPFLVEDLLTFLTSHLLPSSSCQKLHCWVPICWDRDRGNSQTPVAASGEKGWPPSMPKLQHRRGLLNRPSDSKPSALLEGASGVSPASPVGIQSPRPAKPFEPRLRSSLISRFLLGEAWYGLESLL